MKVVRCLLAVCLLFLSVTVLGEKGDTICYVVDHLKYRVLEWDTSVVVSDVDFGERLPVSADGTLVLPSEVTIGGRTLPVSMIEDDAFSGHPELRHLVIGEGIWGLGYNAFQQCINLESIHIPSTLISLDDYSFWGCSRLKKITVADGNPKYDSKDNCNAIISTQDGILKKGCQTTRIPERVTQIGRAAFAGQQSIYDMKIPKGIEIIWACAFEGCVNLSSVSLPKSLKRIGDAAFQGCISLHELFIPENVSEIGENIVGYSQNLKSIKVSPDNKTYDSRDGCNAIVQKDNDRMIAACGDSKIPEGIRSIAPWAFVGIPITEISIPSSVTDIGERAFWGCADCSHIKVASGNAVYDSQGDCNAIIETATGKLVVGCVRTVITDRIREIGSYAFARIPLAKYIKIPEGVETISEEAFYLCSGMEMLILPKSLRTIRRDAFMCCTGLQTVIANSLELYIGDNAFSYNPNLYVVDLPKKVTFESNMVFWKSPFQKIYDKMYGKP